MTHFTLSPLASTIAEGGTYSFSITPSKALASAITVRWEIVAKGKIPISSDDFSAFKGEVDFAASATLAQTISITAPEDTVREVTKTFEIRIYQVTEADDSSSTKPDVALGVTGADANGSDPTKTDDVLLGAQTVTLTDNDEGDFGSLSVDGSGENNVLGVSGTTKIAADGLANNDAYVVTRFQFGDVTISDIFDANLIKFDYGVTITGYAEVSGFGGRRVSVVDLTLSTGTIVKINAPAGKFDFQLGDGAVITTYAAFKTAIGASGTNTASALAKTKTIDSFTSAPDISSNVGGSRRALNGTEHADVIGFGGDFDFSANGIGGNDAYVITRFQSGNVEITDRIGTNIVKFDFGVAITGFSETSTIGFSGFLVSEVALTLSTGAVITILSPVAKFNYQLGDEAVISSYADFKTAIGASGTNAASALAKTYVTDFATIGTVSITHIETINPAPTANIGETLTAVTTGLTDVNDSTLTFTYQWKLGGTDISGATDATYTTTAAGIYTVDVGATDSVYKVTTDFTSARFRVGPDMIDDSAYTELKIGAGGAANVLDASAATGRQLIQGGDGDDTITASAHGDVIVGGYGADTITLGAGVDRVVYRINGAESRAVDGGDIINDFKLGTDKWIFADTDGVSFRAATMAALLDGSVVGNGNVNLSLNADLTVNGFQVNLPVSGNNGGDGRLTVKYSTDHNAYDLLGVPKGDITALGLAVDITNVDYRIIDTAKIINLFGGAAFIDFVDYSTPEDTNLGFEIL